ncbi:hypothetical protein ACFSKN_04750 [Mariniflexile gromovii]|uniref:Uncharacterized protein n=1 Tax=Mariniflexile gromovii TaxID=362523 RepID=A0ABS4BWU5_9FLAO|nr:hypothetical protein [Mariniflexile gromovii]MBP0904843.1 hypothetical protein [Mariniflexile gromovii]
METITNYKLKDFFNQDLQLIEDYVNLLQHLKPISTNVRLTDLTLRQVETIKKTINDENELINIISIVQGITIEEVLELDIITFFPLIKDVQIQLESLVNKEINHLSPKHSDARFEMIDGSKRLEKFGVYNAVNSLANGDILKFNSILDLPYNEVFVKMYLDTTIADIQHEINKMKPINN